MSSAKFWRLTVIVSTACGLSLGGAGTALAAGSARPVTSVTISATSVFVPVDGDTLVRFGGPVQEAQATVSGSVTGIPAGPPDVVATLLVRRFGAKSFTDSGQHATLTPGTDGTTAYSFPVQPNLATSYEVRVSAADATLAVSGAQDVYVIPAMSVTGRTACTRPTCQITLTITSTVPPASFASMASKDLFAYRGVQLSPSSTPAGPAELVLAGSSVSPAADTTVKVVQEAKPSTLTYSVSLRFPVGADGYTWNVNYCTPDTEATDGIGLPGHHGCGDKMVSAASPYLG